MAEKPRIMCWVQTLLGSGHLKRQLMIADAAISAGCPIMIACGGASGQFDLPASVDWVQLPALKSKDMSFSELIDESGRPVSSQLWTQRQAMLRAATQSFQPDVVMTEMFPFGRRKFRHELANWFDSFNPNVRVVCSLRDILVSPKRPERALQTKELVLERYDQILVHSDPSIQTLADTFPYADDIAHKTVHTGYIVDTRAQPTHSTSWHVCVSVGSGVVGRKLIEDAMICHQNTGSRGKPWLIVTGKQVDPSDLERWKAQAGPNLVIEQFRSDLPEAIAASDLSISQAGYNTVVETLHAGTPMVLVPFETETEDEQIQRAIRMESLNRAVVLRERELSATCLARAIEQAEKIERRPLAVDLNGATKTIQSLSQLFFSENK